MLTRKINEISFVFNSDYSGDLHVVVPEHLFSVEKLYGRTTATITVPFSDFKNFFLDYIRTRYITNLENMSLDEFEKLMISEP